MSIAGWLAVVLMAAEVGRPVERPVERPVDHPVHFDNHIIPVLTKAGCNAGACHGAAAGRGGFHLSLLGADPAADFEVIKQAYEGRRINLVHPEASLLLTKPTGQLDHGGDVALDEKSPGAERILEWIRSGATRAAPKRLLNVEIEPRRCIASSIPDSVPLRVIATFEGGPAEDVTAWTVFSSADPAAVEIDRDFVATVRRRGQHVVIARFLDRVVPIQFNVPLSDNRIDLSRESRANLIDEEILSVLSDLRIPVSATASDAAYLRRVTLDLTGRLPEPATVDSYLNDTLSDKRNRLVATLLTSDAFTDHWTLKFARLLQIRSLPNDSDGVKAYSKWLRREIGNDVPLDAMARELLTATGDSHVVGPANFGRMVPDARGQAELVGKFFLGMRLGCANCHNHPLDKWTQDDYHGLAAIFARLDRGRQVQLTARGSVTNLRTNQPAVPRIPGEKYLNADVDHREEVARWVTSGEDRYFAKATVNRLWRALFGRGLVEPMDDMRETNPSTHPELLDRLAEDFIQNNFKIRHTLELIALSNTYGRSEATVAGNEMDDRFYSHAYRRPLSPEVLADAIADVTDVANEFHGRDAGTRAVLLIDPLSPAPSLDILGRCSRAIGCGEDGSVERGLPAQLHLLNGNLINQKLIDPKGRLQGLIAGNKSNEDIVDDFYLRALGRHPDIDERQRWNVRLNSADPDERKKQLEDFAWSLLNSQSFMENH
jgi:hypothetical protein